MIIEGEEVEQPPKKQRLQPLPPLPQLDPLSCYSLTHIPNEIVVNCIARISKSYYPLLSLVSKTFRSLICSPDLYTVRSQIGTTEFCLYICLKFSTIHYTEPYPRWYSLWVKPNGNLTDGRIREKSSGNLFVPFTNHSPSCSNTTVTIGSEIYSFGGSNNQPSSAVWVYDCRNRTSRNLPNMKMERTYAPACVLNDKVYVMGGCCAWLEHESSWFEMFDLKTQTWESLPANPERDVRLGLAIRKILAVKGKIYVKTELNRDWIYDIEERKWSIADGYLSLKWSKSCCVIDNVIYSYSFSESRVVCYELGSGKWRYVSGLEVLRKYRSFSTSGYHPHCMVELVNFGGKLAIIWDRYERRGRSQNKNIWCAMVAVGRLGGGKMKGNIEWVDVVLTVPRSYDFLHCLSVSV